MSKQADLHGDSQLTLEAKKTKTSICHNFSHLIKTAESRWIFCFPTSMLKQYFSGGQLHNPIATGWISTFFPTEFCGSILRWSPIIVGDPLPPIAPPCCSVQTFLFCISLVFHIPVFVQLCCPLWNLVHWELCANVLQRTVLNSNYTCVQPLHTHTQTYRDIQWW